MSDFGPVAQYYSIDVECVATGASHNDRAVAQISLVVSFAAFVTVSRATFGFHKNQKKRD